MIFQVIIHLAEMTYVTMRSCRLRFREFPFLLFVISLASSPHAYAQSGSFRFMQTPGSCAVGLRIIEQYDRSRAFSKAKSTTTSAGEKGRPIQTLIWYPSLPDAHEPMTVGNYVQLADTEPGFGLPDTAENKWRARLLTASAEPLNAKRNARPIAERYPIIIYAPSDSGVPWENADLCEYLASQGYVVLASPSMGVYTHDMTDDLEGLNAQANDISFLISYACTLPNTDPSAVAVVSWSYGGLSSLFAAARDSRIHALVSLDGSLRYYPGLVQQAGNVHPEQMTIPMMFFTQGDLSLEALALDDAPAADRTGPNVLNAWKHGDLYTVHMLGMSHPEFSSMSQRRKTLKRFREDQIADYDRKDTNTGYGLVALYSLNFLNSVLRHDVAAKAFLGRIPAENGAPKHFMDVKFRPAQPKARVETN